jgi:5-methylcytosine-specific restriction enzyme subunit McrC
LIRLLRSGLGIDFEDGERSVPLPGFLFDMDRFFQALISRFLADHLDGYRVRDECGLCGMMEYRAGWNPTQRRAPTPRPDFVVMESNRRVAILDTKYRDLWRKPLPREMLYQLAVYALSGIVPECRATILYPTIDVDATEARIDIRDPITSKHLGDVVLRPVNLARMAELIEAGTNLAARKARVQLATQMALAS